MSDKDINKMDFKELRKEVQSLRDELAKMSRQYEDMFYNLDDKNFSNRIVMEKKGMKTAIKITAEGLESKVSNTDLNNTLESYSILTQTADCIKLVVSATYVDSLIDGEYVKNGTMQTTIRETSDGILQEVSNSYETKDDAALLLENISSISQTAEYIKSTVAKVIEVDGVATTQNSIFTQTADGFTLDGNQTTFTGVIKLTDNAGNDKFAISHDQSQGMQQVLMHSLDNSAPLVLGNTDGVYVGSVGTGNEVATRSWVTSNVGTATAVFG